MSSALEKAQEVLRSHSDIRGHIILRALRFPAFAGAQGWYVLRIRGNDERYICVFGRHLVNLGPPHSVTIGDQTPQIDWKEGYIDRSEIDALYRELEGISICPLADPRYTMTDGESYELSVRPLARGSQSSTWTWYGPVPERWQMIETVFKRTIELVSQALT